jgi:parvulin-like peptidyl-prolyl isomerase
MFLFSSFNLYAQQNLEIVAKVNNKVITSIDVKNRISLLTAGDEEAKKQKNITQVLASQVLADLIREYLQLEYAHESNIKVTDAELDTAFKSIAQKNGLGVKGFEEFLAKNKVSRKSLDEKLEAQIAWNKLVGSKFGKTIQVTADEVNKEYESINSQIEKAKKTPVEVFLSEAWRGDPVETDEAIPLWTALQALPLDEMWADDRFWLEKMLTDEKAHFMGRFLFDGDRMLEHEIDW